METFTLIEFDKPALFSQHDINIEHIVEMEAENERHARLVFSRIHSTNYDRRKVVAFFGTKEEVFSKYLIPRAKVFGPEVEDKLIRQYIKKSDLNLHNPKVVGALI